VRSSAINSLNLPFVRLASSALFSLAFFFERQVASYCRHAQKPIVAFVVEVHEETLQAFHGNVRDCLR
jgi:hypothetical protein